MKKIFVYAQNYIKYIIYFGLVLSCGIFYIFFDFIKRIDSKTQKEIITLREELKDLKEIKEYLSQLNTFIKEKDIKQIKESQAHSIIINTVDTILKNFDAVVVDGLSKRKNHYYIKLKITQKITPELKNFIEKTFTSNRPIYSYEELKIENNQLSTIIELIQPFVED
ncbi:MAG: hypothetical protein GXO21_08580 [Aquificae bacterium]|nr:hypothetical protein [Aquificota bacterium]